MGLNLSAPFIWLLSFIKKIVHFAAKQGHNTPIHDLGPFPEVFADLSATVFGIHVDGNVQNSLALFINQQSCVVGMVGEVDPITIHCNSATAEIQIAQGAL